MNSRKTSRAKRAGVIDSSAEMEAYFGLVRIGRELAVQGLMRDGLTRARAVREWARLERAEFSRRFPKAGIWA